MSLIVTMDSVHPFLLLQNGLYAVSEYSLSRCLWLYRCKGCAATDRGRKSSHFRCLLRRADAPPEEQSGIIRLLRPQQSYRNWTHFALLSSGDPRLNRSSIPHIHKKTKISARRRGKPPHRRIRPVLPAECGKL